MIIAVVCRGKRRGRNAVWYYFHVKTRRWSRQAADIPLHCFTLPHTSQTFRICNSVILEMSELWLVHSRFFSKPILIFSNSKQSNHKQKESFCDDSDEFIAISSGYISHFLPVTNIISFCRFIITRLYFIAIIWTLYLDTCAQRKPSHFWQFPFL